MKLFWLFLSILLHTLVPVTCDWTEVLLDGSKSIDDCKCDVASVREANAQQLHTILLELLNTTYFRLFKVPKDGICPFDVNDEVNTLPDSTFSNLFPEDVEEELCEGENFALGPLAQGGLFGDISSSFNNAAPKSKCEIDTESLDHTITFLEDFALNSATEEEMNCDDETKPSFWLNMCVHIESDEKSDFVNLRKNIEHYTGYNGTKVWNAIYKENCFNNKQEEDMCLEERVLYRLTSGLHSSINTHISLNFFEELQHDSQDVEIRSFSSNPERFVRSIGSFPERVQNLYFSFVFLLRAVKKAELLLKTNDYSVGNPAEEMHISQLIQHLLNSEVIDSCRSVFEAFDEKLLFQSEFEEVKLLKRNFKEIFFNISNYFNCVKCQRCRLHGKMQLLGIGTALKILLVPAENFDILRLSREEIVALMNTLGKFSEAVEAIPTLISKYWETQHDVAPELSAPNGNTDTNSMDMFNLKRAASRAIGLAGKDYSLQKDLQAKMLREVLQENHDILVLAEHFLASQDHEAFFTLALEIIEGDLSTGYDAVIVGSGLAGLTAALTVLDKGGSVAILEKESILGGNSIKASSGINAVTNGNYDLFYDDIVASGGIDSYDQRTLEKVKQLVYESTEALEFLQDRVGLNLSSVGRLGGHSEARTYRPSSGLAGSEMVAMLLKEIQSFVDMGSASILRGSKVLSLEVTNKRISGVQYQSKDNEISHLKAQHVILATGGYAFTDSNNIVLQLNRPDLMSLSSTNGEHAVGDGVELLNESTVSAIFHDLDKVQVHPTGFIKFWDGLNSITKGSEVNSSGTQLKLCAEVLRSVGGILLDKEGKRFVDELQTRDFVSNAMKNHYSDDSLPYFYILLNSRATNEVRSHVKMYQRGGYLREFTNIDLVADNLKINKDYLKDSLAFYYQTSLNNSDAYGRKSLRNTDFLGDSGPFQVGIITPVVHYSMGGVLTNLNGQVLTTNGEILNLYAAGELVGGIHGRNRLGGNALTECVVSGRIAGQSISVHQSIARASPSLIEKQVQLTKYPISEFKKHDREEDCLVQLNDKVYDLTSFIPQHPAGKAPITALCGKDGSGEFEEVHSYELLDGYGINPIGYIP